MAEKKIGTRVFKCEPDDAVSALQLGMTILKVLGPGIKNLGKVLADGNDNSGDAVLAIVGDIIADADTDQVTDLIGKIVARALVREESGEYVQVTPQHHFHSDLAGMIQVALFVLQVNFADFFSAAMQAPAAQKAASSLMPK